jgi:hypothetical protein
VNNEECDINLPADADDLSKHAPALFALKGTEEGYVVPALYFEELSELVVSKACIPEDGGLVVPENYFEESAELIAAKTALPAQDDLTVPENYFEELPAVIEANTALSTFDHAQSDNAGLRTPEKYFEELSANIEAQISLENILPKTEGEVPTGYFSEMENELHVHIALDNVKQDEGFVVPEGYFSDLTDRVLAETSLEKSEVNNDEVPAGYFDSLADTVIARLEKEGSIEKEEERGRVVVLAQWKKFVAVTAVAASVALLVVLALTFINKDDNGDGSMQYAYKPNNLVPENFVNTNPQQPVIDTNSSNNSVVPEKVNTQLANIPKEIKLNPENQVIENDDIIAHTDLMDEALVMDFVSENNMIEETDEVLDPAMMEYLMNDNTSLDVFDPTEKKK